MEIEHTSDCALVVNARHGCTCGAHVKAHYDSLGLTEEQRAAVDRVLDVFDGDSGKVCEAMGMEWDGNMGWNF